jgi:threonine dehydrogenase-like Zn-dependent dehydrogenase
VDRHRRPDGRPLRVALIGFGYWGPNYARVLNDLPGVQLTVVCDRSAERLAHVRTRYPAITTCETVTDVLAGGVVDAVVIATPASTPLENQCLGFVDATNTNRLPLASGVFGRGVVRALAAIKASMRARGAAVEVCG